MTNTTPNQEYDTHLEVSLDPYLAWQAVQTLTTERDALAKGGIIEVAVRNPNVSEYMRHWEGRAEKAEAERDALAEKLAKAIEALKNVIPEAVNDRYITQSPAVERAIDTLAAIKEKNDD